MIGKMKPAPAETRTSRTGRMKSVGTPFAVGSELKLNWKGETKRGEEVEEGTKDDERIFGHLNCCVLSIRIVSYVPLTCVFATHIGKAPKPCFV